MSDHGQPPPPPPPPPPGAPYGGFPTGPTGPAGPRKGKGMLFALIGVALLVVAAIVVTLVLVLGGDDDGNDDSDDRGREDDRSSATADASESPGSDTTEPDASDSTDATAGGAGGMGTDQGDDDVAPLVGTWQGAYVCNQGETALTLTIRAGTDGRPTAVFAFGPSPVNPNVPRGSYQMEGTFQGGTLVLQGGAWIVQPDGYLTVDLEARISDPAGDTITGRVVGASGCTAFTVKRR